MSHQLTKVIARLERVEQFLERVIERLERDRHCGVSVGGAPHIPHRIHDHEAYFISTHNG
jgi:hypothetical protein